MHKTPIKKAVASAGAFALFAGVLLGMPGIAAAAEPGETPAGTTADWAATAPWAAVRTGDAIVPSSFTLGSGDATAIDLAGSIAPDFAGSNACFPVEGMSDCHYGKPTFAGLGAVYTADGSIVNSPNSVSSTHRYASATGGLQKAEIIGEVEVIVGQPEASVTVPIQGDLDGKLPLTGRFYVTDANALTGVYRYVPGDAVNQSEAFGAVPYTVTPVAGGVRFDFDTANGWREAWHGASIRVAAELADGSQGYVMAHVTMPNYGGAPSATSLGYATKVGQTVDIPREDLLNAVSWRTGFDRAITAASLPGTVTETAGGFRWTPVEVGEEVFEFTGAEAQFPVSPVLSNAARVTLTATADEGGPEVPEQPEEPEVIAPTVRDFAFHAPLPEGDAATGEGAAEVPVLSLTEGENFDPAEWRLEAADSLPWNADGSRLFIFPTEDRKALETRWRWASLIDPSVVSDWATVTAPAAAVDPVDPIDPNDPVDPVDPVTPTEPTESVDPPEVKPEPSAPAGKQEPVKPTEARTGDGGSPLLAMLPGTLAALVAAAVGLSVLRRFGQA